MCVKKHHRNIPRGHIFADAYLPQGQAARGQPFSQPAFQSVSQSAYIDAMPGMLLSKFSSSFDLDLVRFCVIKCYVAIW